MLVFINYFMTVIKNSKSTIINYKIGIYNRNLEFFITEIFYAFNYSRTHYYFYLIFYKLKLIFTINFFILIIFHLFI